MPPRRDAGCYRRGGVGCILAAPAEEIVRRIIRDLDAEGRWISTYDGERLIGQPKFERGFRYLSSDAFSRNVQTLAVYLASVRK